MKVKNYQARDGAGFSDDEAVRIGLFLEHKFGEKPRTAADVVAAAAPSRSPIHQHFEWDDHIAAQEYRLEQARHMLRSIEVVFTNGGERGPTRAFHHVAIVTDEGVSRAYVPAQVVWETVDLATQVREEARRELAVWANRYREYQELSELATKVIELLEATG